MPELWPFDYSVIRVVPRVEREEFINVGVIISCQAKDFLKVGIHLDEKRLAALDPALDLPTIRKHLDAIAIICRGGEDARPIGLLPQRARFHWLVAPRSTIIQTAPVHTGLCSDGDVMLEHLLDRMVRPHRQNGEQPQTISTAS